jgi:hypothetical protein
MTGAAFMKLVRVIAAVTTVFLAACSTTATRPAVVWKDAGASSPGDLQLQQDIRHCTQSARQAAIARQQQMGGATLQKVSNLGVGVGVVVAEARVLDSVRDHSFRECMEAAGWALPSRDQSAAAGSAGWL